MDKDFQAWLSKQPVKYLDFLYRQYQLTSILPVININYAFIEAPAPEPNPITEQEITHLEEELTKHGIKRIIGS